MRLEQVGGSIVVDSSEGTAVTTYLVEIPYYGKKKQTYLTAS